MLAATLLLTLATPAQHTGEWHEIHRGGGLVVEARDSGTSVNEMRAVGVVDAPADVLWALVRDVKGHTKLLPDTVSSKILRTEHDAAGNDVTIVVQRAEPAVIAPREYVIASKEIETVLADGRVRHTLSWRTSQATRDVNATHADAVRVQTNTGAWSVEPMADGKSLVTFQLLFDPAGYVPPFLVNISQSVGAQQAMGMLTSRAREVIALRDAHAVKVAQR